MGSSNGDERPGLRGVKQRNQLHGGLCLIRLENDINKPKENRESCGREQYTGKSEGEKGQSEHVPTI